MKFSLESRSDINEIVSYDDNHVVIRFRDNPELLRFETELILSPSKIEQNRTISNDISVDDIAYLKALQAEVIIVTQVSTLKLSLPVLATFSQHSLGIEIMPLGAACRTYNLLANEGRQVILVVKFE